LSKAREEVQEHLSFDYLVVNETITESVEQVMAIVRSEHRRTERNRHRAERILATFPS
jgi:guanylate kinase